MGRQNNKIYDENYEEIVFNNIKKNKKKRKVSLSEEFNFINMEDKKMAKKNKNTKQKVKKGSKKDKPVVETIIEEVIVDEKINKDEKVINMEDKKMAKKNNKTDKIKDKKVQSNKEEKETIVEETKTDKENKKDSKAEKKEKSETENCTEKESSTEDKTVNEDANKEDDGSSKEEIPTKKGGIFKKIGGFINKIKGFFSKKSEDKKGLGSKVIDKLKEVKDLVSSIEAVNKVVKFTSNIFTYVKGFITNNSFLKSIFKFDFKNIFNVILNTVKRA